MSTTIIKPKVSWFSLNIKELARYRDLFYFLAWRDIKVRYKQTAIGILWAVFVPVITMVVFTLFFGSFGQIASDGVPYPIFVYLGLIFWTFFSQALSNASNSLVSNEDIIKKIYFPKLLLPASSILVSLIDFLIANLVLVGLMIYYQFLPQPITVLLFPVLVLLTYFFSFGFGLLLAAVNVKFRDVRFIIPFGIQMMLFLTPVIYPTSIVGPKHRWILELNPMAGIIENARAVVLGTGEMNLRALAVAAVVTGLMFIVGVVYFRKTERYFADII